jgi:hypothetical protein
MWSRKRHKDKVGKVYGTLDSTGHTALLKFIFQSTSGRGDHGLQCLAGHWYGKSFVLLSKTLSTPMLCS